MRFSVLAAVSAANASGARSLSPTAVRGGVRQSKSRRRRKAEPVATWAEREAEAFGATQAEAGKKKRGLLRRLFSRGEGGDASDDDDDDDAVGWFYVDDFGREQGPFSTARMRAVNQ